MYIQEMYIKNFRHLEDVKIGPFNLPSNSSDLIVLAGPNGGGKSSILELLSYALSNSWSIAWHLQRSFPTNAFEIALAVTPEERELIQGHIEPTYHGAYPEIVRAYFNSNYIYYRSYNFPGGRYEENMSLHNSLHNLVSQALRNQYSRSLGFFLKADRFYPPDGFQRDRLFQHSQLLQRDHIWNMAFSTSDVQYRDMFDFLVQQRYHYFRRLGSYHHTHIPDSYSKTDIPVDPLLPYDNLLQTLFPGYRFAEIDEDVPSNLFIQIPSGEIIPFTDLSSGEKEIFFILSFFIRHDVSNAIIVIDEPELHLHPELARILVRTMQSIKPGNQIWIATHNTEIIEEAGRDRVIYVARDPITSKATVSRATDESQALRLMKDLFGVSGYIGIAKRMVFLEGENSSTDRKVFSSLFPNYGSMIKFIPAKSSDNQTRINAAVLSILESDLGWSTFYLIRDRDYLTPEQVNKYNTHSSGRIYVLSRHEIENYLLNDELIAKIQTEFFGKTTTADQVCAKLYKIARRISGEVLRDMISFRLNLLYIPENFSLGKLLNGQAVVDSNGNNVDDSISILQSTITQKANDISKKITDLLSNTSINNLIDEYQNEVRNAVTASDALWRISFPGKRMLEEYARSENLGNPVVLQNLLIKEMAADPIFIPNELQVLIQHIAASEQLRP